MDMADVTTVQTDAVDAEHAPVRIGPVKLGQNVGQNREPTLGQIDILMGKDNDFVLGPIQGGIVGRSAIGTVDLKDDLSLARQGWGTEQILMQKVLKICAATPE